MQFAPFNAVRHAAHAPTRNHQLGLAADHPPSIPVHVWKVDLGVNFPHTDRTLLLDWLSRDECDYAQRFAFERDRIRYENAHAALHCILSAYLGTNPGSVRFETEKHGKPKLAGRTGWHFNMSHSEDCAAIAVSASHPLGIDLELHRELHSPAQLAATILSANEKRDFDQLAETCRLRAIWTCWTRKEAYLKALGLGLSVEPRQVTVGIFDGNVAVASTEDECSTVNVVTFALPAATISVAAVGACPDCTWFDYSPESVRMVPDFVANGHLA